MRSHPISAMSIYCLTPLFTAIFILGLCVQLPLQAQEAHALPDTVYAWGDTLQFVALDRAVDPAGNIDTDLLGLRADQLRRQLDAPMKDGCVDATAELSIDAPPKGFEDIEASLQTSDHILVGTVTGLRAGFHSRLGYLIRVETTEIVKGDPRPEVYVFFPKGKVTFQGTDYCMNHRAYPELPAVGDRMLVMHTDQGHSLLIGTTSTQFVVLPKAGKPEIGGSLVVSSPHREKSTLSFQSGAEVIGWAKQALADGRDQ